MRATAGFRQPCLIKAPVLASSWICVDSYDKPLKNAGGPLAGPSASFNFSSSQICLNQIVSQEALCMVVPDLNRGNLLLITFTPKYFHGVAPVIGLQEHVSGHMLPMGYPYFSYYRMF